MKISVLMLTYNAPNYVLESIKEVNKIKEKMENLELIVLDNNSEIINKNLLKKLKEKNFIDKLILNPKNDLFARGNNLASIF